MDQLGLVKSVYEELDRLKLLRFSKHLPDVPLSGIYLFFEKGETVLLDGKEINRIVRVGINTSKASLPVRIRAHFNDCGVSIFRWHTCCALLAKVNPNNPLLGTFRPYRQRELRTMISKTFRERFTFKCISVPDHYETLRLRHGLIALLAQSPLGPPSKNWLGHYAIRLNKNVPNEKVRQSGLWNEHHLYSEPLTVYEFRRLQELISETISK